eukprot:TRINITY_DN12245_c0_g1_i1.p1 TRINITY_DN12245_c0_g1~~TRINITY_DN12245_c0_g1_i1.p1  ORF type:complete len:221 (+),score=95.42 TRINITY_DN12245_c0_g1_i1:62-724(+)
MGMELLKTEQLIDELERLKQRVKRRDEKMGKRLKNPMCHAHPCQFWPLCAEAYKLNSWNHFQYFRWYDWVQFPTLGAFALFSLSFMRMMQAGGSGWYGTKRHNRWGFSAIIMFLQYVNKCHVVEQRMYGLDENNVEIEQYGPMYPEQIEEAAQRKKKYEQEYIRIKEGLFDMKQVTQRVDVANAYFFDQSNPHMSGYFAEQEQKRKMLKERGEAAKMAAI